MPTRQDDAIRRANAEGLQRLLVGMRRRDEGEPCPEPQRPRGMYPWWEVEQQQQVTDGSGVFHLRTRRHDGSVGLLVDPEPTTICPGRALSIRWHMKLIAN